MQVIAADAIDAALDWPSLIEALAQAFAGAAAAPPRHGHPLPTTSPAGMLLLMPAWRTGAPALIGIKTVAVCPGNNDRGLSAVQASYLLMDGATGVPLAVMDGARLTQWRTAAASALACRLLARPDASRLLLVGAGSLAPFLARAHAAVRRLRHIAIWNRTPATAERLAAQLAAEGLPATATADREAAAREADIISTATLSPEPLIAGAWLRPGTHLDLVGSFTPALREVDDEAVARARIVIDTEEALVKAGDLVHPLASGRIARTRIEGDLAWLVTRGLERPRRAEDITLFKSVGASIEDLAAAALVAERLGLIAGSAGP